MNICTYDLHNIPYETAYGGPRGGGKTPDPEYLFQVIPWSTFNPLIRGLSDNARRQARNRRKALRKKWAK